MYATPDTSNAVHYHYGKFPPGQIDANALLRPLADAVRQLARYDAMLDQMHNSSLLLGPVRRQEAIYSSRMEGTISTLDEILEFEAEESEGETSSSSRARQETMEVHSYSRAISESEATMRNGMPISEALIRSAHNTLLRYGRGAQLNPGEYKTHQNFVGDRSQRTASFVPIDPDSLIPGMKKLIDFMRSDAHTPLIRAAISHVEFEALHPFNDGNGRIGRMLITLYLWDQKQISAPHFYISSYLERKREIYIDLMQRVSSEDDWTSWIEFFLIAITVQSEENIRIVRSIQNLFNTMQTVFQEKLSSKYYPQALEFVFSQPVFFNSNFTNNSGIPRATAASFTRRLVEAELLRTIRPASGRRPALYMFEPLVALLRV